MLTVATPVTPISSRTGFFLGGSADWRNRILLRLYQVQAFADFGQGVLDAVVETAAYILRSLSIKEDRLLTAQLVPELNKVAKDKAGCFSIPKYQKQRIGLKRHQAESELARLTNEGYISPVIGGAFRKYKLTRVVPPTNLPKCATPHFSCVQLTSEADKQSVLHQAIEAISQGAMHPRHFLTAAHLLTQVPGAPFAYWVGHGVRKLFNQYRPFETEARRACITNPAGDDQRYFRCYWEVPTQMLGRFNRWVSIARGGRFSPFYNDARQVVDWDESDGTYRGFTGTVHRPMKRPASLDYFFRPGLTWPLRGSRFSCQALPEGCIFSVSGKFATSDDDSELPILLGLMNSSLFDFLIGFFAGKVGGVQYEVGLINKVPVPDLSSETALQIGQCAIHGFTAARRIDSSNEVSHAFTMPGVLQSRGASLNDRVNSWMECVQDSQAILIQKLEEIDDATFVLYGLSPDERVQIEQSRKMLNGQDEDNRETEDEAMDECMDDPQEDVALDLQTHASALVSYAVGCAFGRWDITMAQQKENIADDCDPFASLPTQARGVLVSTDIAGGNECMPYPLRITADGIVVDGEEQGNGIAALTKDCVDTLFGGTGEFVEKEICDALNVPALTDYFRKPGKGGFWDDHISRYSKSRRKAPIYWLLQSSKKNYAVWLYYHRLDKDLLYKALVNYVEPKIRLETSRLETLRSQSSSAGDSGKEAKRLAKEAEKQEDFLSELRDFEDKLRRAANLHLDPDLNDGVVLNIAPLHELVPWKETKKYWKELMEGKHEWSSIGKQLREKGLVK